MLASCKCFISCHGAPVHGQGNVGLERGDGGDNNITGGGRRHLPPCGLLIQPLPPTPQCSQLENIAKFWPMWNVTPPRHLNGLDHTPHTSLHYTAILHNTTRYTTPLHHTTLRYRAPHNTTTSQHTIHKTKQPPATQHTQYTAHTTIQHNILIHKMKITSQTGSQVVVGLFNMGRKG